MKNNIPVVSIIIGYYKKKNFFKETIKSILNQTYKRFEIILIYDDEDISELHFVKETLKVIKNYKIIINRRNLGAGYSRNKGIKFARGKYIAFCDADDLWNKKKLNKQIKIMEKNKLNFSHSSYKVINSKKIIVGKFNIIKKLSYETLLKSCDIATSSVIIRKDIFKNEKFFSNLKTKEDYSLWLKIAKKEKYLYGIKSYLLYWRSTKDSLSDSIIQKIGDAFRLYYFHEKFNFLTSLFFVMRISFLAFTKKINIYR